MLIRTREAVDIIEAIEAEYRRKVLLGQDPIAIVASPEVEDELRKAGVIPRGKVFAGFWLDETHEARFLLKLASLGVELPFVRNPTYAGNVAFHVKVRHQPHFTRRHIRALEAKM